MELRELKYFLAVAQEGSISAAAEYLFITQPSLSRQMQHLESEVGGPLFVRGSRRITLTERGRLLKKRAEELLELYGKTLAEVSTPAKDVSGEVFIGGGETPVMRYVVRAALNVSRMHPKVKFHFFSGDAPSVMEKLDKGLLDFGLIFGDVDHRKYNSIRFPHEDIWGIIARREDPIAEKTCVTADDLKQLPLLISSEVGENTIREWLNTSEEEPLHIVSTYNLLNNAAIMVKEGVGYAITLDKIIYTGPDSELIFLPLEPLNKAPLHMIWKKYQILSRPAECFLNHIQELADSSASQN